LSRGTEEAILEVVRPFLATLDEDTVVEARDFLVDLSGHEDARVRDASRCWMAALGALLAGLDPAPGPLALAPRQVLELFARGAEKWLEYCDAQFDPRSGDETGLAPHTGLAQVQSRPLQPLRTALVALRASLAADPATGGAVQVQGALDQVLTSLRSLSLFDPPEPE
jgi:hypothetical protein